MIIRSLEIINLLESFVTTKKGCYIFKNPTRSEYTTLYREMQDLNIDRSVKHDEVRIILHDDGDLYICNAEIGGGHITLSSAGLGGMTGIILLGSLQDGYITGLYTDYHEKDTYEDIFNIVFGVEYHMEKGESLGRAAIRVFNLPVEENGFLTRSALDKLKSIAKESDFFKQTLEKNVCIDSKDLAILIDDAIYSVMKRYIRSQVQ